MIRKTLHTIMFFVCFIANCIAQVSGTYLPLSLYEETYGADGEFARYRVYIYNDKKDSIITNLYPKNKIFSLEANEQICVRIGEFSVAKLIESGILPKRRKRGKNRINYKLSITRSCIESENFEYTISSQKINENTDSTIQMCFKPIKPGKAFANISFDIVESSVSESKWECKFPLRLFYEELRFKYTEPTEPPKVIPKEKKTEIIRPPVVYVEPTKPEPIKKDPYEEINKTDINALCEYLNKYPNSPNAKDAQTKISTIDYANWQAVEKSQNIDDFQNYLNSIPAVCPSYLFIHREEANNKIDYLQTSAEWNRVKSSGNETAIINFYKRHRSYKEEVKSLIKKEFPNINITKDIITENDKEKKYIIRGGNTVNPKYKDLSLNKGILIDDSAWPDSMVIEVKDPGLYEILIRDEFGRYDTLNFGYNFKLQGVEQDRKQYTTEVVYDGDRELTTIIMQEGKEIHTVSGLELNKIQLKKEGKVIENEEYVVVIKDENGYRLRSEEKLTIEKSLSVQAIQAIILFTGFITTLFLLFILLRRKRRRDNPAYAA